MSEAYVEVDFSHPRREFQPNQAVFITRHGTSDHKAVEEVFKNNSYRKKHFQVEPGEKWVDMGANIGAFSVLALKCGAKLLGSYEADASNAELTRRNIARNGFVGHVHQVAIVPDSHNSTTATLHTNSEPMSLRRHSTLLARKQSHAVAVPARRFSDVIRETGADCVKLNIEGAEIPILRELSATRRGFGEIRKLVFEYSFDVDRSIPAFRALLDALKVHFPDVMLSKGNIPWGAPTYDYYPPNCFVYALRG